MKTGSSAHNSTAIMANSHRNQMYAIVWAFGRSIVMCIVYTRYSACTFAANAIQPDEHFQLHVACIPVV